MRAENEFEYRVVDRPPSARRRPSSEVSMRGWLQRLDGNGLRSWRRRWCVLADYCLYCYKDDSEQLCDCSVLLPSYKVNPCSREDAITRNFSFKIEHDNMQTIYFSADTKSDLQAWMNALSLATILQSDPGAAYPRPQAQHVKRNGLDENSNSLHDRSTDGYGTFDRASHVPLYQDKSVYRTGGLRDLSQVNRDQLAGDDSHSDSVFENNTSLDQVNEYNIPSEGPLQAKEALRLWRNSDTSARASLTVPDRPSSIASQNSERSPSMINYQKGYNEPRYYENVNDDENEATGLEDDQRTPTNYGPGRPPVPVEYRADYINHLAEVQTPKTRQDFQQAAEMEQMKLTTDNVFQFPESPPVESGRMPSFSGPEAGPVNEEWIQNQRISPDSTPKRPLHDGLASVGGQAQQGERREPPRSPHIGRAQTQYPARMTNDFSTIKEDPSMSDSEILETNRRLRKTYSVSALNGYRPRLSITAADLMGKSHEELVLLLIQLRRDRADLDQTKDTLKDMLEQRKNGEKRYRSIASTNSGAIDALAEADHDYYLTLKAKLDEVENQLDVHTPLINLLDNLVKMGSLYNGQNNLLFSQYKKHLLNPGQVPTTKSMLEFSRRMQEIRLAHEQQNGVKHLREEEVDLNEKTAHLHELDARLQELSIYVRSLQEDKKLLERALMEIEEDERRYRDDPRQMEALAADRSILERQLSDVIQQLADQSKNLEEVSAENHKVEMEVMLLRSKIYDLTKSQSMPTLSGDSYHAKQQLLGDLTRVQDLMNGLTERGQQLQDAMSSLRKSNYDKPNDSLNNDPTKPLRSATYNETDLNTMITRDIGLDRAKKKTQSPKATIKRSYSEREIRPDKREFPPRMDRGRLKHVRDIKRQSERRARGQRYEPPTVKRSQSLPRFFSRPESPDFKANQSFGSTHTLPVNVGRGGSEFSPGLPRRDVNNRLSLGSDGQFDSIPRSRTLSATFPDHSLPRERHSMGPGIDTRAPPRRGFEEFQRHSVSEPRHPRSFDERYGSLSNQHSPTENQTKEPMSPEMHRRPTGYRDVNQMSPIVHRASLPSPSITEPTYEQRFSQSSDLRQLPPSPRMNRNPASPRSQGPSMKSVIPDRVLNGSDFTEITPDSPSVIQEQRSRSSSEREDPFAHLRPKGSLPRGDAMRHLRQQAYQDHSSDPLHRAASPQMTGSAGTGSDPFAHLRPQSRTGSVAEQSRSPNQMNANIQDPSASRRPPIHGSMQRHSMPSSPRGERYDVGDRYSVPSSPRDERYDRKEPPRSLSVNRPYSNGYGPPSHDNRSYAYCPEMPIEQASRLHDYTDPRAPQDYHGSQPSLPRAPQDYHGSQPSLPRQNDVPIPSNSWQPSRGDRSFDSSQGVPKPYENFPPDARQDDYHMTRNQRPTDLENRPPEHYPPVYRDRAQSDIRDYQPRSGSGDPRRASTRSEQDPRRRDGSRERTKPIGGARVGSYSPRMAARHHVQRPTPPDHDQQYYTPDTDMNRERRLAESQRRDIRPSNATQEHSSPRRMIPEAHRNGRGVPPPEYVYHHHLKDDYDSGSDIELRNSHRREFSPARQVQRAPSGGWGSNYAGGDTLIDREVLMAPDKVDIPERYVPESEIDEVSEGEWDHRQEKAEKLRRLLSAQSLQDWRRGEINCPSRSSLHDTVSEERKRRENVLEIRQELAHQAKQLSKQVAVAANERQKMKNLSTEPNNVDDDDQS